MNDAIYNDSYLQWFLFTMILIYNDSYLQWFLLGYILDHSEIVFEVFWKSNFGFFFMKICNGIDFIKKFKTFEFWLFKVKKRFYR